MSTAMDGAWLLVAFDFCWLNLEMRNDERLQEKGTKEGTCGENDFYCHYYGHFSSLGVSFEPFLRVS